MRNYWTYKDQIGIQRVGAMQKFTDYGGTDVTYWFRRDDGTLDLVSGQRLKAAKRLGNFETAPDVPTE